eukprot:TRINITY_DN15907_c0_g1_i1.p1 TRINITY_DN15907_c0_g1~~TRINITY_DN15907_c0_g1_i1.p1  ORF type:complete len:285 (+),score=32.11 TRINITY_DN15907_c0_g1_i1:41-895(+)
MIKSLFDDDFADQDRPKSLWQPPKFLSIAQIRESNEVLYEGSLFRKDPNDEKSFNATYYLLADLGLVELRENAKNADISRVCSSLKFSRMVEIPSPHKDIGEGFRFMKNGLEFELFAQNRSDFQEWRQWLKRFCILTNFHETYNVIKMIGKGSFSKVYLAEHKETHETFAIKALEKERIRKQAKGKQAVLNEIDLMQQLDHPNIIKLYEVYESKGSVYFILEVLRGGELLTRITKNSSFCDRDVKTIMRSALSALVHIHHRNICLLYTSPSPRDRQKSRMPSSA